MSIKELVFSRLIYQFFYKYWPICIMIYIGRRTMSKFNVAFSLINIRVMVFKPLVPNEDIRFSQFGYCYNHLFLIVVHSELYFNIVCYWSFLIYTTISISYRNWFNDFLSTDIIFPNEFL